MPVKSDHDRFNDSTKDTGPMQIAKDSLRIRGLEERKDFLDITALIRSIQRAEGNFDCFRRGQGYCDQVHCAWRDYCLEEHMTCKET